MGKVNKKLNAKVKAGGSVVSPPLMVTRRGKRQVEDLKDKAVSVKKQKLNKQHTLLKARQEQQKKDESTIISDEPCSLVVEDDKTEKAVVTPSKEKAINGDLHVESNLEDGVMNMESEDTPESESHEDYNNSDDNNIQRQVPQSETPVETNETNNSTQVSLTKTAHQAKETENFTQEKMDIDDKEEDSKASRELAPEIQKAGPVSVPKILADAEKTNDLSIKEHGDLEKGFEESDNDASEAEKSIKEMNANDLEDAPTRAPEDALNQAPEDALNQAPEDAPKQVPEDAPTQAPEDAPKQASEDALKQAELTSPEKQTKSINPTGSKRLFVGNLDFKISEAQVKKFFERKVLASDIVKVDLAETPDGKAKGFGHVEFATQEAVQKAFELQNQTLFNRTVNLDIARERGASSKDDRARGDNRTVYVRGFDNTLGEDKIKGWLKEYFGHCGEITRISLPKVYGVDTFKGLAYVEFSDPECLSKALELDRSEVGGRCLTVEKANPRRYKYDSVAGGKGRRGGSAGGRSGGSAGRRSGSRDGFSKGGCFGAGRGEGPDDFSNVGRGRGGGPDDFSYGVHFGDGRGGGLDDFSNGGHFGGGCGGGPDDFSNSGHFGSDRGGGRDDFSNGGRFGGGRDDFRNGGGFGGGRGGGPDDFNNGGGFNGGGPDDFSYGDRFGGGHGGHCDGFANGVGFDGFNNDGGFDRFGNGGFDGPSYGNGDGVFDGGFDGPSYGNGDGVFDGGFDGPRFGNGGGGLDSGFVAGSGGVSGGHDGFVRQGHDGFGGGRGGGGFKGRGRDRKGKRRGGGGRRGQQ